ncbi:hypothetical protein GXB85_13415 [Cellulomonas sp. APG4]|uniref:hypothetical protein n=1 Tax=Cellulomonas sp. APG4 TaxID=1538656 RepID=UPI0013799E76|nr:hypothetical protein [Cellulomonas sp. APG4]NCT91941.1 hypothetical protein [Cellulomonas sp. APG4]
MSDVLIASTGSYRFDIDALQAAASSRWPGMRRFDGAGSGDGQLQHVGADNRLLDVTSLRAGHGLGVEGDPERVAEFMAWLTTQPGFPSDGSIEVYNWALDIMHLAPGAQVGELLASLP